MDAIETLLLQIEEKYKNISPYPKIWEEESPRIKTLLQLIQTAISPRYTLDSAIDVGGGGIVCKVKDTIMNNIQALKFPRPSTGKEPLLANIMEAEIARLTESVHENIIPIYYKDQVRESTQEWPFYIMEYIDGAKDMQKYLKTTDVDYDRFVSLLSQVAQGLEYFHNHDTIHCDIKLENVFVTLDGDAKIADLGSARSLKDKETPSTTFVVTLPWAHPDIVSKKETSNPTDPNRVRGSIERSALRVEFDLYAFGKNILRVLKNASYKVTLTEYQHRYLELMACRMLDGKNNDEELSFLDLPKKVFEEIKYSSITEVIEDIKKLTGESTLHEQVPELDHHFPRTIQISSIGATPLTNRLQKLLSSPFFRRLASVSQLGFITQIYPSASHSRLEHVLGTFANAARYCDALWNDPINPLFKQIMTKKDIDTVLVSALCHDIGQYPLAHDFEGAENNIFSHATMGEKILESDTEEGIALRDSIKKDWHIEPKAIKELLSAKLNDPTIPLKTRLLNSILDSPIDADKIDYLIRDSAHLNVPYGKCIDFERLLRCLTVVLTTKFASNVFISIGIHEKGKIPAESVAFVRYAMFGSVYWHHTSRSAKSMLHRAVWETLENPKIDNKTLQEDLYEELLRQGYCKADIIPDGTLFPDKVVLAKTPQLAQTDYQMLVWLSSKTTNAGKIILKMICERELFKRLLVLSHQGNPILWDQLIVFRKEKNWQDNLNFQRKVQKNLIEAITSKASNDEIKALQEMDAKGEILFILDVAITSKGSTSDLYYLPETRTHGPVLSSKNENKMEDSLLWQSVASDFVKSVGKARLFCHPNETIIMLCSTYLSRREIEGAIDAALKSAR